MPGWEWVAALAVGEGGTLRRRLLSLGADLCVCGVARETDAIVRGRC